MPILSFEGVTVAYSEQVVLNEVSFDIRRGRTVAVVGESGSGKSTTARVIIGNAAAPERSRSLRGEGAVAELPPAVQGLAAADPDDLPNDRYRTEPALTIAQIVGRPVRFQSGPKGRGRLRARVDELLDQIEMDPTIFRDRQPGELSGAQKQSIGIVRALAAEPRLIICDKMTSALDQLVAEGILKFLARLQGDLGLSYMFITHDLATVKAIADEVVVMKEGRVIEQGPRPRCSCCRTTPTPACCCPRCPR